MFPARKEVELIVRVENAVGALEKVLLAVHGIRVLAYCVYAERNAAVVLLVTENAARAVFALETAGFSCQTDPVLLIEAVERFQVARLGERLGKEGIQILHSYSSAAGDGKFCAVFRTNNDDKALLLIQQVASEPTAIEPTRPPAESLSPPADPPENRAPEA